MGKSFANSPTEAGVATDDRTARILLARLDRIPTWALPRLFALIIGIGFLFTFYDIFDINVSFVQTCHALVPGCTPARASNYIGPPVLFNLVGYVLGTLMLSPMSDRLGRRKLLLTTMTLCGIGSALTAVAHSYATLVAARAFTGIGIGADLAVVNTYIGELAPRDARARATSPLPPVPQQIPPAPPTDDALSFTTIFRNRLYRNRTLMLSTMWFLAYITVYSFAAGFTTLLAALKFPPPEAGLITAVGTFGFVLCAIVSYAHGERMERKHWMPLAALITLAGSLLIALGGRDISFAILGSIIVFFGFNLWVPIVYAWSVEHYPTRARTTGFALVDGIGHLGGGVGIFVIAPLIPQMGVLGSFLLIGGFLVVAALVAQFGVPTRSRLLDEISP